MRLPLSGLMSTGVLCFFGCGANEVSEDAGPCLAHAACGGNVLGTWQFSDQCVGGGGTASPTNFTSPVSCSTVWPSVTYASSTAWTITFNADGSFEDDFAGIATEVLHYPAPCLAKESDAYEACSAIESALQAAVAPVADASAPASAFLSATCILDGSGNCDCSLPTTESPPHHARGAYKATGGRLTFEESADGGANTLTGIWDYCVLDNTLTLSSPPLATLVGTR